MKRHWIPIYVGDYLADTSHLTTEQHGAYFLLMLHYWATGSLPTTDKQLMAIARMDPESWAYNSLAIARFFDENWRHKRLDKEIAKAKKITEARSLAGLKGAWKRSNGAVPKSWQ